MNAIYSFLLKNKIWHRITKIKSEASWVLTGQIINVAGTLLGIKIITHVLSPDEFGRLSLATTLISLISMNLFGPIGQGLSRFWSISKDKNGLSTFGEISKRYVKNLVLLTIVINVVIAILSAFFSSKSWTLLIIFSIFVGGFTGVTRIHLLTMVAARRRKVVALINSIVSLGKPLIAFLVITWFISNAYGAMIGYLLATIISAFVAYIFYSKTIKQSLLAHAVNISDKDEAKKLSKEILLFSMPFYIWTAFSWLYQSCDRWALASFHDADIVGAYSVISFIAVYPLIFFSNFLNNLLVPIAYERAGSFESDTPVRSANKILVLMSGLYICGASFFILVLIFFHKEIVIALSSYEYSKLSYLLPYLAISWALFYFGQVLSGFGMLANKPNKYIVPVTISSLTAVVSTFYFSSKFGPEGVIWGLGISGLVYSIWFLIVAMNMIKTISVTNNSAGVV